MSNAQKLSTEEVSARNARILELLAEGRKVSEVAKLAKVHSVTVYKVKSDAKSGKVLTPQFPGLGAAPVDSKALEQARRELKYYKERCTYLETGALELVISMAKDKLAV